MSRNVLLLGFLVFAQVFGLSARVVAQDTSVIANMTNACINSTYKLFNPNMAAPTFIRIDRRVTINPVTVCTTAAINSVSCNRDPGSPMVLVASVAGAQITMNPFCSWNCGGCGTIITGGSDGLPVELLDFKVTAVPKAPSPPKELSKTDPLVSPRS